jgi:hypothetical protein
MLHVVLQFVNVFTSHAQWMCRAEQLSFVSSQLPALVVIVSSVAKFGFAGGK